MGASLWAFLPLPRNSQALTWERGFTGPEFSVLVSEPCDWPAPSAQPSPGGDVSKEQTVGLENPEGCQGSADSAYLLRWRWQCGVAKTWWPFRACGLEQRSFSFHPWPCHLLQPSQPTSLARCLKNNWCENVLLPRRSYFA